MLVAPHPVVGLGAFVDLVVLLEEHSQVESGVSVPDLQDLHTVSIFPPPLGLDVDLLAAKGGDDPVRLVVVGDRVREALCLVLKIKFVFSL